MLVLENVTKQYKAGRPVFSGYSATFPPGNIVGLIGPNGSGKTTFLRLLSLNSYPTEGSIFFEGTDIHAFPPEYLKETGLVHDEEVLPIHLTARELLEWIMRSRNRWEEENQPMKQIDNILDRLSLADRDERIGTFSTGMRKKTQIAAAMILKPKILIMDEPLRGLDKSTRIVVSKLISEAKKNGALVLMSSHSMDPDDKIFDEIIEFPL
ncbi:MAG: ABC transporter ATP-binding protein [Balneolaceae bacterium]